jgi:membrane-associated phospholipid phosphatase
VVLPEDVAVLFAGSTYPEAVRQGPLFKTMAFLYRAFDSPGAALPSSHVAIALTTLWFSYRYLPRIRHVHLVLAIFLCIATVYCRYHYVVDVLAGLAAAALLVPLGNRLYFKFQDLEGVAPNVDAPQRVRS